MQLNTKASNIQKEITHTSNIHQSIRQPQQRRSESDSIDTIDTYHQIIHENIGYDVLCQRYDIERMNEIVELLLEVVTSSRPFIRIAKDDLPTAVVKSRLLKVDSSHVEYVFECFDRNTTKVRNIKSYLLTALYNAPATIDSYYRAEVNHNLYGDGL